MRVNNASPGFPVDAQPTLNPTRSEPAQGGKLNPASGDQVVLSSAVASTLNNSSAANIRD